jgi:hypothetical protein
MGQTKRNKREADEIILALDQAKSIYNHRYRNGIDAINNPPATPSEEIALAQLIVSIREKEYLQSIFHLFLDLISEPIQ